MWKFIEDLKKDFDGAKKDVQDEQKERETQQAVEEQALTRGAMAVKGHEIVSLENATVEMVNQNQNEIEIYFDNGTGMGIRFALGPALARVLVSPGEKVREGQPIVDFGPQSVPSAEVYAFTPDMIRTLSGDLV